MTKAQSSFKDEFKCGAVKLCKLPDSQLLAPQQAADHGLRRTAQRPAAIDV
jgi:hypothetical protein